MNFISIQAYLKVVIYLHPSLSEKVVNFFKSVVQKE